MVSPKRDLRGTGESNTAGAAASVRMYLTAYEEGKRTVDDQVAELDSMRQRSVQFLAFVSGATAFLVGAGLQSSDQSERTAGFYTLAGAATVASICAIVFAVLILLAVVVAEPKSDEDLAVKQPSEARRRLMRAPWNFRISPAVLVEHWIEPDVGAAAEAQYYRGLAMHYDAKALENDPYLSQVRRSYLAMLICGSVQVLLWAALVWVFS